MKPLDCCTDAFPINTCADTLNAWQISGVFSAVAFTARFLNVQRNQQIVYISGNTGALGELIIDLSTLPKGFLTPNYTYQLTIFIGNTRQKLLIGGVDHECIQFCVEDNSPNNEILPLFKDIPQTAAMLFTANEGVLVNEQTTKVIRWNNFGSFNLDAVQSNNADRPTRGVNKVVFDGSNVLCADGVKLDLSGSYLQVLTRFKLTNNTAPISQYQTITSQYDATNIPKQSFSLYIDSQGDIIFFDVQDDNGNDVKSRHIDNVPLLDQDIIVNAVFDSGEVNFYINGTSRQKATFADDEVGALIDVDAPFNIGANSANAPGFGSAFAGDIFGVVAWNVKPSAAEWVYWYNLLKSI